MLTIVIKFVIFFFDVRKDFDPKEKEKKEELVASCFFAVKSVNLVQL